MLWCFWIVVLEKTLESLLDFREIKPVNPKGNQPWILIGRTDTKTEAPILCPPDAKSRLLGKDPDTGKDWGQEEKGKIEDEMTGWHHWLNGRVWANSGTRWRIGKLGVLQSMELQRVGHNWLTELNEIIWPCGFIFCKIFIHSFYFSACDFFLHIFYFFLVWIWKIVFF